MLSPEKATGGVTLAQPQRKAHKLGFCTCLGTSISIDKWLPHLIDHTFPFTSVEWQIS